MPSFKYRGLQAPLKGQKEEITAGQGKHRISILVGLKVFSGVKEPIRWHLLTSLGPQIRTDGLLDKYLDRLETRNQESTEGLVLHAGDRTSSITHDRLERNLANLDSDRCQ